uniref:Uncharacterized protein n=1 Tax=Arundo donax TaxID=35708 RepID=A0A0A9ST57_ARUDO
MKMERYVVCFLWHVYTSSFCIKVGAICSLLNKNK